MDINKSSPSTLATSAMTILSLVIRGYANITPRWNGGHKPSNSPIVLCSVPSPLIKSGDVPMLQKQLSLQVVVVIPKSTSRNDCWKVLSLPGGPENHAPPFVVLSKIPVLRPFLPPMRFLSPSLTL